MGTAGASPLFFQRHENSKPRSRGAFLWAWATKGGKRKRVARVKKVNRSVLGTAPAHIHSPDLDLIFVLFGPRRFRTGTIVDQRPFVNVSSYNFMKKLAKRKTFTAPATLESYHICPTYPKGCLRAAANAVLLVLRWQRLLIPSQNCAGAMLLRRKPTSRR